MKAFFLILLTLYIIIYVASCFPSKYIVVTFENNSNKFIDSTIIHIQNYKFSFKSINPHTKVSKNILKDSIALNKHDIMVHAYLFDKAKSNFTGGFYYEDLSGSLNDKYSIILNENLFVQIK